jgi:hypothetical protein
MGDNLTSFSLHILLAFLDLLISLVCLLMMSDYFWLLRIVIFLAVAKQM